MRLRGPGTQLEGAEERLLRALPVPIVVHGDQATHSMRLPETGVQLQRPRDRRSSLRHGLPGGQYPEARVEPDLTLGEAGVGGSEALVVPDRLPEGSDGPPHGVFGPLAQGMEPPQISVVGPRAPGSGPSDRRAHELARQLAHDGCRDLVLDGEDVGQLAVEALRPELVAVLGI